MVYDFLYLITSYDRYDKLKSLIDNILKFKHNFKIIVIDDCSKDERYSDLKNYNEKLIYLRNQENYGKEKFWLTIDTIFKKASEYNFKNGVMLQDDFELIPDFENLIEKRIGNNNEIIRIFTQNNIGNTNWGYENWIDGAYCAPFSFFKSLNFEIFPIRLLNPNGSSGVGNQLTERLNRLKYKVVNYGSMVEHIGNFDSKMHPEHRKKQPLFANFKPNNYKLSIIIPTYNNVNFLPECFDSILNSIKDLDCEILVGVDNCEETLKYINNNSFDKRFNFYFFNKNLGPYIIKNTLVTLSSSDKILFFDSDDIMMEELIQDVLEYLNTFKMYKPMYIDFTNKNDVKDVINIKTNKFGEGVFAVNKQTFLELNGFEGWRCAADSDFMGRFYRKNFNFKLGRSISFLRRVHSNSLTSHPDTGLSSQLRGYYHKLSKRNNKTVCEILNIHNFTEIEVNYNLDKKYEEFLMRKNIAEQVISKVLSGGVNKSEINYDKINEVISNKGYYNPKTSIKPIRENLPKNRNEIIQKKNGSNTEQIKKIIPTKQNRRKDLPNIFSKKNK